MARLPRIVLAAAALAVAGWLLGSLVAAERQREAQPIVERASRRPISEAELRRGSALLRAARRFNEDKSPVYEEAVLLTAANRAGAARKLLTQVVADEPSNVRAWTLLFALTGSPSALHRIRELNPWAADALERVRPRAR